MVRMSLRLLAAIVALLVACRLVDATLVRPSA